MPNASSAHSEHGVKKRVRAGERALDGKEGRKERDTDTATARKERDGAAHAVSRTKTRSASIGPCPRAGRSVGGADAARPSLAHSLALLFHLI